MGRHRHLPGGQLPGSRLRKTAHSTSLRCSPRLPVRVTHTQAASCRRHLTVPVPARSPAGAPHTQLHRRDLAAHIDGFIATTAHTVVLSPEATVTGRPADLLLAAQTALEAAIRLVRPGSRSADVAPVLQKVRCPGPRNVGVTHE